MTALPGALTEYLMSGNSLTRTATSIWMDGTSSSWMISEMWDRALSNQLEGDSWKTHQLTNQINWETLPLRQLSSTQTQTWTLNQTPTRSLKRTWMCWPSSRSRPAILFLFLEDVQMILPRMRARRYSMRTRWWTSDTSRWYGAPSIRWYFLKWSLISSTIWSNGSGLLNHFLFTRRSNKGWLERENWSCDLDQNARLILTSPEMTEQWSEGFKAFLLDRRVCSVLRC